jgi:hypothetical protein
MSQNSVLKGPYYRRERSSDQSYGKTLVREDLGDSRKYTEGSWGGIAALRAALCNVYWRTFITLYLLGRGWLSILIQPTSHM